MPELPEVETVMRGLTPVLTGRVIRTVETRRADLRVPFPPDLKQRLEGRRVSHLARRAKYCQVFLEDGTCLVIHLGMSGRMLTGKKLLPQKHDHFILTLDDGVQVVLNDPRRFGMVLLIDKGGTEAHPSFAGLGPEPLGEAFDAAYLKARLAGKLQPVKLAIMDQGLVVGVGNIYACEALYRAGIDPAAFAGSLTRARLEKLVEAIKAVLNEAIEAGGSSLKDYVRTNGELGYFQHRFSVYDREGLICPRCKDAGKKTPCIRRIVQGGRSTFYCARTQR